MPKILTPIIHTKMSSLWGEGLPYETKNIYSIKNGNLPPVNYDTHILKPHSLTHVETSLHTQLNGVSIDESYRRSLDSYYGIVLVIKFRGNNYKPINPERTLFHWEISHHELSTALKDFDCNQLKKIFITTESHPINSDGFHDPNYVLTLSKDAANFLISNFKINLFGTSWKSSDFKPGSKERPIHDILFQTAVIAECLDLREVEEGFHFVVCPPLPLKDASESPVVPLLFNKNEIINIF
jgi:kynurenine formamidase